MAIIAGLIAVAVVASLAVLSRITRKRHRTDTVVETVLESEMTTRTDFPDNPVAAVQREKRYRSFSSTETDKRKDRREQFIRSIVESGPKESWSTEAQSAISSALLTLPADIQSRLAPGQLRCAAAACIVDVTTSDTADQKAVEELFLQRSAEALHAWPGWIQYESTRDGERTTTTFAVMKPEDRQKTLEKGRQIHGN